MTHGQALDAVQVRAGRRDRANVGEL